MDVWQAVNSIRVVREFADRPLDPEHLDRILNAARRTASSKNKQEWAFIVVRDRDHLRELTRVGRYADHLAGAAAAIALITPDRGGSTLPWDLGRAAQNMVLVAWELGIGSVPATCHNKQIASELLGLPPDMRCDFILSFGFPADASKLTAPNRAGGRVSLDSVVREERW
jgi:nitroreductase